MPRARTLAMVLVLVAAFALPTATASRSTPLPHRQPTVRRAAPARRSVILFVGDGMGQPLLYAARIFKALPAPGTAGAVGRGRPAEGALVAVGKLAMDGMRVRGVLDNHSADALVTDSAAPATALSTGVRVPAHDLAQTAEGAALPTILEAARDRGLATGVVTTLTITNATPAAFVAHGTTRVDEGELAKQVAGAGVDVLLGGGQMFFYPRGVVGGNRVDGRNLAVEMQQKGYTLAVTRDELQGASGARELLGLFAPGALDYELDRNPSRQPSLAEMTAAALGSLEPNPPGRRDGRAQVGFPNRGAGSRKGFFLLVHAGRIDWAGHDNDLAAAIHDVLALDDAVATALHYAKEHPETLVIAIDNHETGGLTFPPGFNLAPLAAVHASVEQVLRGLGASRLDPNLPAFQDAMRSQLGLELDVPARERIKLADHDALRILRVIADAEAAAAGVQFSCHEHTALPPFVYAQGPGDAELAGYHDVTDVYAVMKRVLRL